MVATGLDMINKFYGSPYKYFYSIAGAPYFDLGAANSRNDLTSTDVLQILTNTSAQVPTAHLLDTNVALALFYQMSIFSQFFNRLYLAMLAYGAGPDTSGPNSIAAKKAASLDENMKVVIEQYLTSWYNHGGSLCVWNRFVASNWDTSEGTW